MGEAALKILIADDDEGDRKQVMRVIKGAGFACDFVETASIDQALAACERGRFDLAMVDYRMPGRDGLDGIAALHARCPHMPIVMSTGQGDEDVAAEAMKRGASDYLPKAKVEPAAIRSIIQAALDNESLRQKVGRQEEQLRQFADMLAYGLKAGSLPPAGHTAAQIDAPPAPVKSLRLLIADDDEGDRRQIRRDLDHARFEYGCTETATIEDAIAACESNEFDCAILDYRMPGKDGLEGISALHKRQPNLAIVMLTGKGNELVATEAIKRGALDYLSKPRMDSISLRRAIESAMEKAALRRKTAEHRHELENFASGLVRNLKAPITAIETFASFVKDDIRGRQMDRQIIDDHCQAVVEASQRMAMVIDALYNYTSVDAQPRREPVEMRQVAGNAVGNLRTLIGQRRARVTVDDLPVAIGDVGQLTLLMQHLIENALKYCETEVPVIRISAQHDEGDSWVFTVADNGVGVPEQYRGEIFEPFRRLPQAGLQEGAGLGLTVCKKIARQHGGAIWCEAGPQGGCAFKFRLPNCLPNPLRQ